MIKNKFFFRFFSSRPATNNVAVIALVHQLKSALVTIKWPLKMMEEGDYGHINQEQRAVIEKILSKNEEFILLVSDLLSVEKSKVSGSGDSRSLENLESIIRGLVNVNREEATHKKITIMFTKEADAIPDIMIDKKMIILAIQNLIDNAIKYSLAHGEIIISLSVDKKSIQCRIQDCGIGIMEKDKDKIFRQFFRGTNAIKVNSVGSGLGLFIAKNIIEDHKGSLWFESKENKGSTFCFSLPLHST